MYPYGMFGQIDFTQIYLSVFVYTDIAEVVYHLQDNQMYTVFRQTKFSTTKERKLFLRKGSNNYGKVFSSKRKQHKC